MYRRNIKRNVHRKPRGAPQANNRINPFKSKASGQLLKFVFASDQAFDSACKGITPGF